MLAERLDNYYHTSIRHSQSTRELASISLESRQLPDIYFLEVKKDKITPPGSDVPVESYMSVNSPLDKKEFDAFLRIQSWAASENQGLAFWISPPHIERSTQGKIIISELQTLENTKILINRAILFESANSFCVTLANDIQSHFQLNTRFVSEDDIRNQPIIVNGDFFTDDWLPLLEQSITQAINQWKMVKQGKDCEESNRTLEWAQASENSNLSVNTLVQTETGFIGQNVLSCPLIQQNSPMEVMRQLSLEGKFVKNCGNCGCSINKVIAKGYKCENCGGVYEGC